MDLKKALKRTQKKAQKNAKKNAEKTNFRQKIAIFSEKNYFFKTKKQIIALKN